ncbi:hypothetical protein SAMN02910301_0417 [Lachnospiraceae bacterium XBD2001]|nr:hypothetical protein SAMN02910301_0417 [Lachnospiraceae bacterium XBD2001]
MFIVILFFIFPMVVGALFENHSSVAEQYIKGAILELAIFNVCYYILIFVMRSNSLQTLTEGYTIILLALAFIGLGKSLHKRMQYGQQMHDIVLAVKENKLLTIVMLVIIAYQMLRLGVGVPTQVRDSLDYDSMVLQMVENGLVYGWRGTTEFNPQQLMYISPKFVTTPWYVYEAYVAKIIEVHPLIILRTFMPIYIMLLAYMALWFLGRELLYDSCSKRMMFVIICGILYESRLVFGEQSAYMLVWPTWGKSVASAVICTLLIAWYIRIMGQDDSHRCRGDALWLYLVCFAGTATTAAVMMAFPVALGALSLVYGVYKKSLKPIGVGIIGGIPCVMELAIYEVYTHHLLDAWFMRAGV